MTPWIDNRVLCLGDSITQGRKGGPGFPPFRSYRYPLWTMCVDAGLDVDFVGNVVGGFDGDPDWPDYKGRAFPRRHEGHWGWPTHNLRKKLPEWTLGLMWDVALVLLGTNDPAYGLKPDDSRREMSGILDFLRERNPNVAILLGLPCPPWAPFPRLRAGLAELAREKTSARSPVDLVDLSKGWIARPGRPDSHSVDWIHPTDAGDLHLARSWFHALRPRLATAGKLLR